MNALGFSLAEADQPSSTDESDEANWIAESGAEAGWGCTDAHVTIGGVTFYYKRLTFDLATICGGA